MYNPYAVSERFRPLPLAAVHAITQGSRLTHIAGPHLRLPLLDPQAPPLCRFYLHQDGLQVIICRSRLRRSRSPLWRGTPLHLGPASPALDCGHG